MGAFGTSYVGPAAGSATGALAIASNLSDLASAPTSRYNLGVADGDGNAVVNPRSGTTPKIAKFNPITDTAGEVTLVPGYVALEDNTSHNNSTYEHQFSLNYRNETSGMWSGIFMESGYDDGAGTTSLELYNQFRYKTSQTPTSVVRSSNVVTVTCANHGMLTGQEIVFTGLTSGYEPAALTKITVTGANTFTYAKAGANGTAAAPGTFAPIVLRPGWNTYCRWAMNVVSYVNSDTITFYEATQQSQMASWTFGAGQTSTFDFYGTITCGTLTATTITNVGRTNTSNTWAGQQTISSGVLQVTSFSNPASGSGAEIGFDGSQVIIQGVNRANGGNWPVWINYGNGLFKAGKSGSTSVIAGSLSLDDCPTGDPHVAGVIFRTANALMISTGG